MEGSRKEHSWPTELNPQRRLIGESVARNILPVDIVDVFLIVFFHGNQILFGFCLVLEHQGTCLFRKVYVVSNKSETKSYYDSVWRNRVLICIKKTLVSFCWPLLLCGFQGTRVSHWFVWLKTVGAGMLGLVEWRWFKNKTSDTLLSIIDLEMLKESRELRLNQTLFGRKWLQTKFLFLCNNFLKSFVDKTWRNSDVHCLSQVKRTSR